MTATKIDILEIVIGGMADRIPPINPDSNPVAYGAVGALLDMHRAMTQKCAGIYRVLPGAKNKSK